MPLNLNDKKSIVTEVSEVAKRATSVVAANYAGLTVPQITQLRELARKEEVRVRVVRNTLARLAFKGTQFACMDSALVGPLVLAFSYEDPGAAARLFRDFAKKFEKLEVKALSIDGVLLPANDLGRLANLPTRNEAISMLMSVMQAPITQFVRTLVEPPSKLVRTFAALRDKKQQSA
ncbi:MAG: rplJ [Gammaproteobacteria bacterium]|nr:rplJ [Gammaproteobacteria bacterium]